VVSTSRLGRDREYRVRDHMIAAGWTCVMRAAASKGAGDLLMGHPLHGAALVQVGSGSKVLSPADRDRFTTACDLISALPILAVVVPRQPIAYWHVTRDTASTWAQWQPANPPGWWR